MGDRTLNHLSKYKKFYEENNLKFQKDMDDIPTANGIDCMCDHPKNCGYSCHSGIPCELFKPNNIFEKTKTNHNGIEPKDIDFEKDYFAPVKSEQELKIEELEERIAKLESKITITEVKK